MGEKGVHFSYPYPSPRMTATKDAAPESLKTKATKTKRSANVPGQFNGYAVERRC